MDNKALSDLKINIERDFNILQIIGQGSYGSVLEVQRRKDKGLFALKTVYFDESNPDSIEQFLKEVRMLAQINHKCIITLYGFQMRENQIRILLERMDMSLDDYMRKLMQPEESFTKDQLFRIFYSLMEGLSFVYTNYKIAHRDVKPGNILVDRSLKSIKLADFGCAKIIDHNADANTQMFSLQVGTQVYMAPEHRKAYENFYSQFKNKKTSQPYGLLNPLKTDSFSVGMVMLKLLSRKEMDVVLRTKKKRLNMDEEFLEKYLSHVLPRIPKLMKKLILNMLKFDPDQRMDILEVWRCLQVSKQKEQYPESTEEEEQLSLLIEKELETVLESKKRGTMYTFLKGEEYKNKDKSNDSSGDCTIF